MKLIVAGDRDFNNYDFVKSKLDSILSQVDEDIEIVSGKCKGVDKLGEEYAAENGYPIKPFPADWDKYGKAAGPIRNKQMAEYGTHLVAFLKKGSKGTKSMIEIATELKLPIRVINI